MMNTTRCCLLLLVTAAFLGGCTGALFVPADRIDADGDGFFAVEDPNGELSDRDYLVQLAAQLADSENPLDLVAARLDCDDGNDNTFPNAAEQCDGEDNDCDGSLADFEADLDEDGFSECAWEHDKDETKRDCNDDPDPEGVGRYQHPDRPEVCGYHPQVASLVREGFSLQYEGMLVDDNCDGELAEDEVDQDLDGYTICEQVVNIAVDDPLAEPTLAGDCIDTNASVYPDNATITCLDSGEFTSACTPDDQSLATVYYRDIDGDENGSADPTDDDGDGLPNVGYKTCTGGRPPGSWVEITAQNPAPTDCDDFDPNRNGKDTDNDGFTSCPTLSDPELRTDCDDDSEDTYPDAPEACDAEDNDCDGDVDEDYDNDEDGSFAVGDEDVTAGLPSINCADRGTAQDPYVEDCDDNDPAFEGLDVDEDGFSTCGPDGIPGNADDDCADGDDTQRPEDIDEDGFNTCAGPNQDCDDEDETLTPVDGDGDGFAPCANAQGLADCDDTDADVFPGNGSVQCDGVSDTDCDGQTDPLDADDDSDGFSECAGDCNDQDPLVLPVDGDSDGFSTCTGDCDDDEATVFPGAPQDCDLFEDNDCNGAADANQADVDGDGETICGGDCDDFNSALTSADADNDNSTPCQGDCDDSDATIGHLTDADGDGWTACGSFGSSVPVSQAVPADCDDGDAGMNWTDVDGDGQPTCVDPADALTVGDCDDNDSEMHDMDFDSDGVSPCGPDGDPGTADDDCDDSDPLSSGAKPEVRDGIDNDCSGIADDFLTVDPVTIGDLAVVEIMIGAPLLGGDGPAEYFEVYNNSGFDLDLRGWEVDVTSTLTGDTITTPFDVAIGPDAAMLIPDGARAVIARSGSASPTAYSSEIADFYWSGPAFSDAGGSIALRFEGTDIDTLTWEQSACISNCEPGQANPSWSGTSTWRPGHAMGLQNLGSDPHLQNNNQVNLCEELTAQVSSLLYGTPGNPPGSPGSCDGT